MSSREDASGTTDEFKARIVALILDTQPEEALRLLSEHYHVQVPPISVGVVKGRSRGVLAVYSENKKAIFAARREYLYDPFTVLHEFYHHLRSFAGEHRGTEKHADRFAINFIEAYNRRVARLGQAGK